MLLSLLDSWLSPPPEEGRVAWLRQGDFAHRGLHSAQVPENSRAAFAAAMAAGHGIELDVQRSSDGHSVVFHDDTLDRLTGETGLVKRRTARQLGEIRLAGSEETIPTLRQVLAQVAGRVPVLIEVKAEDGSGTAGHCLAVRRVLEGYTGPHAVMSFDPRVLRWFRKYSPRTLCGLVMTEEDSSRLTGAIVRHLALWHARPDFLAYDIRDLPSRFASSQRARGLALATWTVRGSEQAERAARHADAPIFELETGGESRA